MSDSWCYTHETAICGPVSADALRQLLRTGGLSPTDMVWPEGEDQAAVPASALAWLAGAAPASPAAVPDWVPGLAAALESRADTSPPASPPLESWLADVRRSEEPPTAPLKADVSPEPLPVELLPSEPLPVEVLPSEPVAYEVLAPEPAPVEEEPLEVPRFYGPRPPPRGSWLGRIPKRLIFIGLGIIIEVVVIIILLTCLPDQGQEKAPARHTTQRGP